MFEQEIPEAAFGGETEGIQFRMFLHCTHVANLEEKHIRKYSFGCLSVDPMWRTWTRNTQERMFLHCTHVSNRKSNFIRHLTRMHDVPEADVDLGRLLWIYPRDDLRVSTTPWQL